MPKTRTEHERQQMAFTAEGLDTLADEKEARLKASRERARCLRYVKKGGLLTPDALNGVAIYRSLTRSTAPFNALTVLEVCRKLGVLVPMAGDTTAADLGELFE